MAEIITIVIALAASCPLFFAAWKRIGPAVLRLTESHALQIAAMAAVFAAIFCVLTAALRWAGRLVFS
ncbi:hypothetical protein MUN46_006955 [Mesosutterella sp. AGMB02718]|uniref:Uncharacterized protein n=1 Tax=Mesosutterella faecium TaxID=2925194 RepID=A0ABT7IMS3_9BURK|nr:hypothetical protein [Mesosutterella sp. AGMB02718]MDL2059665.1 hypothetical protein [Mesosutterella sp. AGMB02718]